MSKVDCAVIDLDNCISDDAWRMHLCELHHTAPNDRYHKYHAQCEGDLYRNSWIVRELARKYKALFVFTSRPEEVRFKTQRWLNRWRVPVNGIIMRPTDNHEPSTVLKERMLKEMLDEKYKVRYAIDDREDILKMYADNGIQTQKVFINHPEIIHP